MICGINPEYVFCFAVISKLYGDQARFFDLEKVPRIKHRKKGTVSMVNNGSDQHGSQVGCTESNYDTTNRTFPLCSYLPQLLKIPSESCVIWSQKYVIYVLTVVVNVAP